jgi:Tol biopolymer transport system component
MPRFRPFQVVMVAALLTIAASTAQLGAPLLASPYAISREEKSEVARHVSTTSTGADTRKTEAATTGITSLVSIASDGQQGNADSGLVRIKAVPGNYIAIPPAISGDGRYIAFVSDASNLAPNASLGRTGIYVRDRLTDQTVRVTEAQDGTEANYDSSNPAMSASGRFIAFSSAASNLLPDTWNGWSQVYLHDQQTGQLTLISKDSSGNPLTGGAFVLALSGDGRYAALRVNSYYSPSLVLYDIVTASTVITISQDPQAASLSFDGRYLAFMTSSDLLPGGQDSYDVYRFDRVAGTTQRVSVSSSGVAGDSTSGDPAISADGRYVAFASSASNLAPCLGSCYQDIFVHDCDTGNTYRILVGLDGLSANESSFSPSISADGRYIAFMSHASNLVPGNRMAFYDLFVIDRTTGAISRISEAYDDTPSDGDSHMPRMSGDGRFVAYDSFASNLIAGDTNGYPDVFVYDRLGGSFSVSGKVLNSSSIPIPGVMISAGVGHSTITDSSGYYTITSLITGTYTIMPAKVGFTFSPITRTVSVPLDVSGEDFLGVSAAWIPFHNISSSCTNWTPLTSTNFTISLTNGTFSVDGTKLQGTYWAEAAGFETSEQFDNNRPIILKMTGSVTGTGSGWATELRLADNQHAVAVASVHDVPSGRRFVNIRPVTGRYVYPLDIGGCGTGTVIAENIDLAQPHIYKMTYSERSTGSGVIASVTASVDDGTPVTVDLPWRLNSPNALLVATARAVGDSVHATMTGVAAGTSYSITGRVTNSSNAPIPNVMVSAGSNFSTTTNSSGYYTITGLIMGTYALTPTKSCYTFSPPSRIVSVPNAIPQDFRADIIDLSIDSVLPVQVLEGPNLVKDKLTAVKAVIRKRGCGTANNVSVRFNIGELTFSRFYVAEPANMNSQYMLTADNATYPLTFTTNEVTKTIYLFSDSLAPTGSTFQASVTVDYLGTIVESDETNNTTLSVSVPVYDRRWGWVYPELSLRYFRTDWENALPTLFNSFYAASNEFIKGVFPVADGRYIPAKSSEDLDTGSSSDNKLTQQELIFWVRWNIIRWKLSYKESDRFVAVVPPGWFVNNTTLGDISGKTFAEKGYNPGPNIENMVIVEAYVTTTLNGNINAAHEIGHSYKLRLQCEEYDQNCDGVPDRYGNSVSAGLWVDRKMVIDSSRNVYCMMGGLGALEYWIEAEDYGKLLGGQEIRSMFAPNMNSHATTTNTLSILATGLILEDGTVALSDWYLLPAAERTDPPPGAYVFKYLDANGGLLYQQSFDLSNTMGSLIPAEEPFIYTIPFISGAVTITIENNGSKLAEKVISAHAPVVNLMYPNGGESLKGQTTIQWSGSDIDGDTLSYAVLVSLDNGVTWETVSIDIDGNSYVWDSSRYPPGPQYRIKIIATDGFNTGEDISNAPFTNLGFVYLPLILRNH